MNDAIAGNLVRVGTRASALSMAQTAEVIARLQTCQPHIQFQIVTVISDGDRRKSDPLSSLGRGAFASRLEESLLSGQIDIAVHSVKDMTSDTPDGLTVAAYTKRADARDIIVNRWGATLGEMPSGAILGTSSPRRIGQLLAVRPDILFVHIRGNVDTRLAKLLTSECDGVVLAAAGLQRLKRIEEAHDFLDPSVCLPDAGQGALAIQIRSGDMRTAGIASAADDAETAIAVKAERAFVAAIGGGCRVPAAAYATIHGRDLFIMTMACLPDGSQIFRSETTAPLSDPIPAGRAAAESLAATGAGKILRGGDGS